MIRKLLNGDIDRVADIWLKTNLKAHYFISNQYWKSNYELVKEMMSQSEVYVYEDDKMIQGFVGLNAEYIEGIFVSDEMQSCGIGKLLLDYIKDKKVSLRLNVYQKNARAISFYQREGFIIQCEGLDEATGEKEYICYGNENRNRNLSENLSIDHLAERFFFSKYHMMRKFKKETGYTIHTYFISKRLLHARSLIAQGTPVMKAAMQSGFQDYTAFVRAYKKQFGTVPTQR